jgi:hypothetical protein
MENTLLHSESLSAALKLYVGTRIGEKINAVLSEDEQYAADELVELAEETLANIAAIGFAHYVRSSQQKEVYNDFLIQLFTSSGHDYNAGPLYRWAANMVVDNTELKAKDLLRFFWQVEGEKIVLAEHVHSLAELRNRVMHGFFILPPEENSKQADAIGVLLIDLHKSGFFSNDDAFHFISNGNFTGQWNITDESQWVQLISDNRFGLLVKQILHQRDDSFWVSENNVIDQLDQQFIPKSFSDFVTQQQRGSYALWIHPKDQYNEHYFTQMSQWLRQQKNILTIAYTLQETGISFTGGFLIDRLLKLLNTTGKALSSNKKKEEHLKLLRKSHNGKIVVLINRIETALFSSQHVTKLFSFLQELDIMIVAVGQHFEHFNTFFTVSETILHTTSVPDTANRVSILHNYLRFKGPHADKKEDEQDVKVLKEIMDKLCEGLQLGQKIYARRFADEHQYDMEYVHEIFAVLYPWVITTREKFEEDTIDELYGFPSIITETTPIYLALGRRDLKLEYQHKVISL